MRSRIDARIERRGKGKKSVPVPGGKALQRLFDYLGQRDPALTDVVVSEFGVPKSVRPKFLLARRAKAVKPRGGKAAKTARAARARRPGGASPEAKSLASAIIKAANKYAQKTPKARANRSAPMAAAAPGAAASAPMPPPPPPATWRAIGPSVIPNGQTYGSNTIDVIGRVSCIAVDPNNAAHILVGAAGGGIWESTNTGGTWAPRTDQMPSLAIGAIVFDPTAPSRVYAGSGEGNFYFNLGAGVYKSTNSGTTWAVIASAPFIGVGFYDLVINPQNPAILYAATTSGFYVSTNSGVNWSLKRNVRCWDISVGVVGLSTEILAAFQDGLFISTNNGTIFAAVSLPANPAGSFNRLAVDRVKTAPTVAYAFGAKGATPLLWRRTGAVWTKITTLPAVSTGQAWYDWYVAATPNNQNEVYLGEISGFRGNLSGVTWTWTPIVTNGNNSIHPDQHCLTFAPNNTNVIYAGNDGGIYRSANKGATWTALCKGLGITEIEYMASNPNTWQWLLAGTQDNGTIRFTGSMVWDHSAGGDGGDCGVNQLTPTLCYHAFFSATLQRSTNSGTNWTSVVPPPPPPPAVPPNALPSLFYAPVEVANLTVAIGSSPMIYTRNGAAPFTTFALGLGANEFPSAMRALDPNTLLIGTTLGKMMRLVWNGATWVKTNLASPNPRYISCIAGDPSNPNRYWVTISQLGGGLVYRSDNAGVAWVNCTAALPAIPMRSIVVDPANFQRVWVSADVGVYQTLNLGGSWAVYGTGLPNAMAADLVLHAQDRKLFCGTRNRGAWVTTI
jgi:hypothetical protein